MLAKKPAVMPVISELVFWFQAHTEMPKADMMFTGNSSTNKNAATPAATPRSARRRDFWGFSLGASLTHTTTVSR